jgi:S-disulfanyl-L-cysteine oxidoreductase SoxD
MSRKMWDPALAGFFLQAIISAGILWLATVAFAAEDRTVWDGVYTEEQATRGRVDYTKSCASCHGADLRGSNTAPSLVEESFAFLFGDMTVGELYGRIRMLMPSDRPNSLSSQSYLDIVTFILQSNKFPAGEKELDADPETLRQILITTRR